MRKFVGYIIAAQSGLIECMFLTSVHSLDQQKCCILFPDIHTAINEFQLYSQTLKVEYTNEFTVL